MTAPDNTHPSLAPTAANSIIPAARRAALADLAFGSFSRADLPHGAASAIAARRHLAFLPADTLELDLADPTQRRFGDYELLELIGEGGMGVVYRARQIGLDREVAVKLLSAGPWASREFVERFRREAQNAARMQHPNIVAIYEVGTAEELHFFSMRLVRGPSLAQLIAEERRPPLRRCAVLLRAIAEAVDYAHRLNVLHLDLKPANVLLDENGDPHVADFGLARRIDQIIASDTYEVSGTPSYMAPEQAQLDSHKLSPATDIWGLGAILHELVTGQPPYRAGSAQATLKLVIEARVPSPRRLNAEVPLDLEAVILRCMTRDPRERYGSARELADDLGRFIEGRAVKARPLSGVQRTLRWCRREPKLAATALLAVGTLLLGLVATTQQWRRADGNAQLAARNASLANTRLWQTRLDQAASSIAVGNHHAALPGIAANIKEREAQGLDARDDRVRFATIERSAPRLIDAIAMGSYVAAVALSPDGSGVAVSTGGGVVRTLDVSDGAQRWQTVAKDATHFWNDKQPQVMQMLRFSSDGRYLIGAKHSPAELVITPFGVDEVLFDATTGHVQVPEPAQFADFRDATFSPDGAFAMVRSRDHQTVLMRTEGWHAVGTPAPFNRANPGWLLTAGAHHLASITRGFTELALHDPRSLAVRHRITFDAVASAWTSNPQGTTLLVGFVDGEIQRIDLDSGRHTRVTPSLLGRVGAVTFSADGRWFGAVADSSEVLVWDAASTTLVAPPMRLNTEPGFHVDQIVIDAVTRQVLATSDAQLGLWKLPGDGAVAQKLSGEFPHALPGRPRAFALDGLRGLVVTGGHEGEVRFWRLPPPPLNWRSAPLPSEHPISADGHVVAVDKRSIRVVSASDGHAISASIELPQAPAFASLTADGTHLVAIVGASLHVFDPTDSSLRYPVVALPNDPLRVALSADSRTLVLVYADDRNGLNAELGESRDLETGFAASPVVALAHLGEGLRFDGGGQTLLRWFSGGLERLDARTLQPIWRVADLAVKRAAADAAEGAGGSPASAAISRLHINEARFSADGTRIVVLTGDDAADRLWQLDARNGERVADTILSGTAGVDGFVMLPNASGLLLQRARVGPLLWDGTSTPTPLPGLGRAESRALALAPDGRTFARALDDAIALGTVDGGQWITPPMRTFLAAGDHPIMLEFNRSGSAVIGRSRRNHWLFRDVSPDLRDVGQLEREASFVHSDPMLMGGAIMPALPAQVRRALRQNDPGEAAVSTRATGDPGTLERTAGTSPLQLDLGRFYNWNPSKREPRDRLAIDLPAFVLGSHRFFGIDYDVRGAIRLSMLQYSHSGSGNAPWPQRVAGIDPGLPRFAALHLLVTGNATLQTGQLLPYARLEFVYRDGTRARLPITYIRDVLPHWMNSDHDHDENAVRVAWSSENPGEPRDTFQKARIYAVRIANPYPDRAVASLGLEASEHAWSSPAFFAITIEPLGSAAHEFEVGGHGYAQPKNKNDVLDQLDAPRRSLH